MRNFILLGIFFSLVPVAYAAEGQPTVRITKVEQKQKDGITSFDFFIKANDDKGIAKIEYRAGVNGFKGEWVKYPYYQYPGFVNHLPFSVDCKSFSFEVRSIDKNRNKSRVVTRTYTNLR